MSLSRAVSISLWSWRDNVGSRPSNDGSSKDKLFIFPLQFCFPVQNRSVSKKKSQRTEGTKIWKVSRPYICQRTGDWEYARNKHRVFCNFGSIGQLAFHSRPHDSPGKLVKPSKHRGLVKQNKRACRKGRTGHAYFSTIDRGCGQSQSVTWNWCSCLSKLFWFFLRQ